MKEESMTIPVIVTILTTVSTAILSIEIIAGFIMTNEAEAQQQPLSKSNATATIPQNPNKTIGSFDNQTAIHEVINATRNTNATGVLAGQIINATTPKMTNQAR
jgi:spermidine/putrescine-binding protein